MYLFPFAITFLFSQSTLVNPLRAAQETQRPELVAGQLIAGLSLYALSSWATKSVVTESRARPLMCVGALWIAALSGVMLVWTQVEALPLLQAALAAGVACAMLAFQVYMRTRLSEGAAQRRGVSRYTTAWSLGFCAGPFFAGVVMEWIGWEYAHGTAVVGGALLAAAAWFMFPKIAKARTAPASPAPEDSAAPTGEPSAAAPNLIWVGWAAGLTVSIVNTGLLNANWPSQVAELGLSESWAGAIRAVISLTQALTAAFVGIFGAWMFKPSRLLIPAALGVSAYAMLFSFTHPVALLFAGLVCGGFSGLCFYLFTFYAVSHPEHGARYVSINEILVGLGGIVGATISLIVPMLLTDPFYNEVYPVAIALILGMAIFQQLAFRRARRRAHPPMPGESLAESPA